VFTYASPEIIQSLRLLQREPRRDDMSGQGVGRTANEDVLTFSIRRRTLSTSAG
jgi:hypothetical protein